MTERIVQKLPYSRSVGQECNIPKKPLALTLQKIHRLTVANSFAQSDCLKKSS